MLSTPFTCTAVVPRDGAMTFQKMAKVKMVGWNRLSGWLADWSVIAQAERSMGERASTCLCMVLYPRLFIS